MRLINSLKSFGSRRGVFVRFRNINIALFIFASLIMAATMFFALRGITKKVSEDYARLYATNTVGALGTHLNGEIAVMTKAARSRQVMDWFADEDNFEKKAMAHEEMLAIVDVLYSDNLYIGIEKTLHEFTVEEGFAVDDIKAFATLDPNYFDDAWYFECRDSEQDYVFNVDVDKILHRKRVWLNYRVSDNGVPLGVICSGLEFAEVAEAEFSEFDSSRVQGLIIDKAGIVHMDSSLMGESDFLQYEVEYTIDDKISNPELLSAINSHNAGIDGYFDNTEEPVVIELDSGPYSYATIAGIAATDWSVITLYNASSLFSTSRLLPAFLIMLVLFILFAFSISSMSYWLIFTPFYQLNKSVALMKTDNDSCIYGRDRQDEFGELSNTIQDMKDRLDSYNTDLEKEVAERSAHLKLAYEQVEEQNQLILSSISYASKIQRNLLPRTSIFETAFSDYSVIWHPRDIVGGDIYWIKSFSEGTVVCVADCTGHGTPGALLTMLVVSAFEAEVNENNYKDTAEIVLLLEQRLTSVLNVDTDSSIIDKTSIIDDGCDLAVMYIANDKSVSISSGHIHVFVCDGQEVTQVKGQRIFLGEGKIKSKECINTTVIPANPNNKFYVASDGLFDQLGGDPRRPFGYKRFKQVILENHGREQKIIAEKIWEAFESYRGEQPRRDDVELVTFKP